MAATDITNIAPVEHPAEDDSPIHWYYNGAGINAAHENAENEDDDESEEDFDNTEESFFLFEPSPWVQTWEQAIEETDATSDNGDEHLQALLQSQLNTPRSLDEQKDFEEALLVWLAEKPPVLTLSYQLAKTYFRWDQRLEHWSRNDYPWYMLDSLDERYQHVSYFQSPAAFRGFLSHRFPTVASYFPLKNSHDIENNAEETREPLKIKFSYIFRRLFFPFRVIGLAQELKTLDAELDYYIHDHPAASELGGTNTDNNNGTFNARYWQQESPLKTLNDWILKRFIEFEDFGLIALIVAAVLTMFSLFSQKPWLSFYYDGIGVFVVISLYYLFWQLQLRLFATPEKFVSYGPWTTGWRNASALLFILGYISWLDISKLDSIGMPTSPVYFLTHLAGASLFAANSIRQRNFIVTAISWHAGVLILVLAVLIPVFVIVVEQPSYPIPSVFPISPLFWLLLATPAFLISLSESYPRLEWLDNVGDKLLAMWNWLMLIGRFYFTYLLC